VFKGKRGSTGNWYWEIKVEGCGRKWPLEHRHIMSQRLGRKLLHKEIVHHIDDDGLNNDPDNLELTDSVSHTKHHTKGIKPNCSCVCPDCGKTLEHFAKGIRRDSVRGKVHAV
jgi:hypothetical protein